MGFIEQRQWRGSEANLSKNGLLLLSWILMPGSYLTEVLT